MTEENNKKSDRKEYHKEWNSKNKEHLKRYKKEWYLKDREKTDYLKKGRLYRLKNTDKIREWSRKYIRNNKERINERSKIYKKKYPERIKGESKARYSIPLKDNCEICNSKNNLQRHHWRYDKPLIVNTLCKPCHSIQHIKNFKSDWGLV